MATTRKATRKQFEILEYAEDVNPPRLTLAFRIFATDAAQAARKASKTAWGAGRSTIDVQSARLGAASRVTIAV
jgi:hypothetical protein